MSTIKSPLFNPLLDPGEPSEFGRGFTLCILKFLEHVGSGPLTIIDDIPGLTLPSGPGGGIRDPEHFALGLWFNASSDHFYDLRVPPGRETESFVKLAQKVAGRALDIGHGGGLLRTVVYGADYANAVYDCVQVLMMVDKEFHQKLFWNLAGIVTHDCKDLPGFTRNATIYLGSVLKPLIIMGDKTPDNVKVLATELVRYHSFESCDFRDINRKIFEIAVTFDIEAGIDDATIGQY